MMITKYQAILLLAGKSTRFCSQCNTNKLLYKINDKYLFEYSLDYFINDSLCEKIVVVTNDEIKSLITHNSKIIFTDGGKMRYQSVLKGLEKIDSEYVIVHDGARPLIKKSYIESLLKALEEYNSVSIGTKVTSTIKKVESDKVITIPRDNLYEVQTPQGAKTEVLKNALIKVKESDNITDDLMAFEKYTNERIKIIIGSISNIKVTTIEDIDLIKYYLNKGDYNV